jgi:hypothetical protein
LERLTEALDGIGTAVEKHRQTARATELEKFAIPG